MTPSDWSSLGARFSVRGALPISLSLLETDLDDEGQPVLAAHLEMTVPDWTTGQATTIGICPRIPEEARDWSERDALEWLRSHVHWFYRHEADEQIVLDDWRRPFYPAGEHG